MWRGMSRRRRLIVTDNASQARQDVIWGPRATHYSASNPLLIDSASLVTTGFAGGHDPDGGVLLERGRARIAVRDPGRRCGSATSRTSASYRLRARVWATDDATVRLAWKVGDGSLALNDEVDVPFAGPFAESTSGRSRSRRSRPARSNGRGRSKRRPQRPAPPSTLTTSNCSCRSRGTAARPLPPTYDATTLDALDTFDQTAGALAGKTANVGGTWRDRRRRRLQHHRAQRHAHERQRHRPAARAARGRATWTNVVVQVSMLAPGCSTLGFPKWA
jgi:hypothetical protein